MIKPNKTPQPVTKPVVAAKKYDETFKRQAVENWMRNKRPGTQIAKELGVSYPSLKDWRRRYGGEAVPTDAELEIEVRALRAELVRVREQRDILKKTLGILSEPSSNAMSASRR
jgi:transposase